jgi:hypothetical protein
MGFCPVEGGEGGVGGVIDYRHGKGEIVCVEGCGSGELSR